MRGQRSDPSGDVEWAEAFPFGQLGRRGRLAPPPEVFQLAGMDIVKRLRPALREPRAVALECRKVVVDHFIPLLDEAGTAEEFDSPQRRRDAEISAEKTKMSRDNLQAFCRSCLCLCSLRLS